MSRRLTTSWPAAATRRTGARGAGLVVLTGAGHLLAFALTVAAARLLAPDDYSRVMALFGVWGMVALPTTAVQLALARWLAGSTAAATGAGAPTGTGAPAGPGGPAVTEPFAGGAAGGFRARSRRALTRILAVATPPALAAAWAVAQRLGLAWGAVAGAMLVALWIGSAVAWARGVAQAELRFVRFGVAGLVEAAVRLGGFVVLVVALPHGAEAALVAALALGGGAGVATLLPGGERADRSPPPRGALLASIRGALLVTLAGGVLSNLDLVWSRGTLAQPQAAAFAAGTLASRPFLLLGAVAGTLALPYVARGALGAGALLRAAGALAGLGLAGAALMSAFAAPLVRVLFGAAYASGAETVRLAAFGGALLAPAALLATAALGLPEAARSPGSPPWPARRISVPLLYLLVAAALAPLELAVARSPAGFWSLAGGAAVVFDVLAAWTLTARIPRP